MVAKCMEGKTRLRCFFVALAFTFSPLSLLLFPTICRWFHGNISREEAERLLRKDGRKNGTYLVRESQNYKGDYTLCVQ